MNKFIRGGYLLLYYILAQHLPKSTFPVFGFMGEKIRLFLCHKLFASMGKNVNVENNAYIGNGSRISIGDNSGIGAYFHVQNTNLKIGNNVMMGEEVLILGGGHRNDRLDIPMLVQGELPLSDLEICDDVWVGSRATIMGKVSRIGKGVIIGAGSVVTKPIPDYAVVAGNPAKILRFRNDKNNARQ